MEKCPILLFFLKTAPACYAAKRHKGRKRNNSAAKERAERKETNTLNAFTHALLAHLNCRFCVEPPSPLRLAGRKPSELLRALRP